MLLCRGGMLQLSVVFELFISHEFCCNPTRVIANSFRVMYNVQLCDLATDGLTVLRLLQIVNSSCLFVFSDRNKTQEDRRYAMV